METMAVRVSDQEANVERSASEPVFFTSLASETGVQICGVFSKNVLPVRHGWFSKQSLRRACQRDVAGSVFCRLFHRSA